jgi:anti-sigma regulatory factor (Ser/Thr protein kinase)
VTDVVTLQLPRDRDFFAVAHLVLGGLGARLNLTYDVLEDMTTAIDELLNRRESMEDVTLTVTIEKSAITATVGPFSGRVADDLRASDAGLGLRRVLETSVDEVGLSERAGAQWVELTKKLRAVADAGQ